MRTVWPPEVIARLVAEAVESRAISMVRTSPAFRSGACDSTNHRDSCPAGGVEHVIVSRPPFKSRRAFDST